MINPITPATNEEIKITSLELLIMVSLSNASKVMNMDIVNPIPAKKPRPKIDFQLISAGNLHILKLTAINVKIKIPSGLPIIRPNAIPKL
jgi:hypothetical protein